MVAPNSSLPQIICTSYDTSASITVGTGTVTVTTYTDITENAIVQPILNYPNRFRVVAAGLKANFAGALTEGSGTFNAGWFPGNIRNTGGFLPHSYYSRHINSEVYQCREGITVSMPVSTESLLFYPAQAVTADARHGGWPFIIYRGLSATSVIQVNAIMYLEVILPPASIPFSLGSTDCEQALAPILAFANASDRVVSGHSFKSLASLLGNRMKGAFRFVSDNWGVINAAGQLAARALAL
jgi:hypothetical protein